MRFEFLGTGTSAGVPLIGCECAVCTSEDARDRRLRTAGVIQFSDSSGKPRTILLDAGPDLREQSLRAKLTRCDAILFTHNHVDHTFGLDEVRRFNAVMRAPIDLYADGHTLDHLRRVYKHIFDRQNNVNDSFVATLITHQIEPERAFDLFGLRVTPIKLLHGKLPILGYRFDATDVLAETSGSPFPLAYCTDVSGIPTETWGKLKGLKTLVLDALRHTHHPTHFTLDQAIDAAERIGADRTYFVHMSHDLGHAATDETLPEGMRLGYDGLVLE